MRPPWVIELGNKTANEEESSDPEGRTSPTRGTRPTIWLTRHILA